MSTELWSAVDRYIGQHLIPDDPALAAAQAASKAAGLPDIAVAPNQGKWLSLLARAIGARRILELGALGGYSTIWLARALADGGRLISLEIDPGHADVARASVAHAGLAGKVEIRVGAALELLPQLAAERAGPFDLTFIDADKANIPAYFDWAVRLSRSGALIVVDNVVRKGALIDAAHATPELLGVRRLHESVASDTRVSATTIQTVGAKGHDGFLFALVQ
jgi:predicted O-methyltransferase YrrM